MRLSCCLVLAAFGVGACGGSVDMGGGAGAAGAAAGGSSGTGTGGTGTGGTGAIGGAGGTGAVGGYAGAGGGPACCIDDAACAPGGECAAGYCHPFVNSCWRDSDCGPGAVCAGASLCPCPALCAVADHPGNCVMPPPPPPPGCCGIDADCGGGGYECVGGKCEPRTQQPTCWRDSDCGMYAVCVSSYVCPCGAPVMCTQIDHPGNCEYYDAADAGGAP